MNGLSHVRLQFTKQAFIHLVWNLVSRYVIIITLFGVCIFHLTEPMNNENFI